MKQRCFNPRAEGYENYGGRGITVDPSWLSFETFNRDMGSRPDKSYSLDRINNNGNYEPANCIWSDRIQQNRNKRVNPNSKSGVTGVTYDKFTGKWVATIGLNGKTIHLGRKETLEEAVEARRKAELEYWT